MSRRIATLALLASLSVLLAGCPAQKPRPKSALGAPHGIILDDNGETPAVLRDIEDAVDVTGFVEPANPPFEVRSEISGKIEKIHVAVGDAVKKGRKLVEMDDSLLKADFDEAQRNEQLYVLQLEKAERDSKRQDALRAEGFSTERDALDAKTAYELAKLNLSVQRARLDKAASSLSKTIIYAPYDGIVSDINVSEGQAVVGAGSVNSGTLLMRVNDFSKLQVSVRFNEFDVAKIALGKSGDVTFDSEPGKRVASRITYLSPFAVSDQSQRVFPAKVTLDTAGVAVAPGISANIRFVTERVKGVVAVPVSAVFVEGGERVVYLKKGDKDFVRTLVKTGINDDGYIRVVSGLKVGDIVTLVRPEAFN